MSNEPDSPEENNWEAADAESTPIEKNAAGPELHDPGALGGASADAAEETTTEGQEGTVEEDLEGAEEFQNESFVDLFLTF